MTETFSQSARKTHNLSICTADNIPDKIIFGVKKDILNNNSDYVFWYTEGIAILINDVTELHFTYCNIGCPHSEILTSYGTDKSYLYCPDDDEIKLSLRGKFIPIGFDLL